MEREKGVDCIADQTNRGQADSVEFRWSLWRRDDASASSAGLSGSALDEGGIPDHRHESSSLYAFITIPLRFPQMQDLTGHQGRFSGLGRNIGHPEASLSFCQQANSRIEPSTG